jgi:TolB protein
MVTIREDIGDQTYWRVYLKTRYQDGSQGQPIERIPWDLNARYGGNPQIYEQGGSPLAAPPAGYWFDFTDFALRYGWERQPALLNWRTYYTGSRVNEFAFSQGLDWRAAMLQLYPPETLVTPTSVLADQSSSTPIPTWYKTRTPTPLPSATITPTRRPTWTPGP